MAKFNARSFNSREEVEDPEVYDLEQRLIELKKDRTKGTKEERKAKDDEYHDVAQQLSEVRLQHRAELEMAGLRVPVGTIIGGDSPARMGDAEKSNGSEG